MGDIEHQLRLKSIENIQLLDSQNQKNEVKHCEDEITDEIQIKFDENCAWFQAVDERLQSVTH